MISKPPGAQLQRIEIGLLVLALIALPLGLSGSTAAIGEATSNTSTSLISEDTEDSVTITVNDSTGSSDSETISITIDAKDSDEDGSPDDTDEDSSTTEFAFSGGTVKIPTKYVSETGDGVGPSGLGDAASDFRTGDIGPTTLGDVAIVFRKS
jgi:hypothetical protein